MIRLTTLIIVFSFFIGCAGAGIKSASAVFAQIDAMQGSNAVFVKRDTGYAGSAALLSIKLNGAEVGKIGDGEVISGTGVSGKNFIEASFGGVSVMGMKGESQTFELEPSENAYFLINMKVKMLSTELQMMEVSEATFKNSF